MTQNSSNIKNYKLYYKSQLSIKVKRWFNGIHLYIFFLYSKLYLTIG